MCTTIVTVEDSALTNGARRRSPEADAVAAAVAQHVRSLRQARSWSLEELAHRSGVSKGMIVQIEGGRTNPSIGTLCRLAESFGVSVGRLIEADREPRVRVIPAGGAPALWQGELGSEGRLLVGVNDAAFVEFWTLLVAPGERLDSDDHAPGTREIVHVLAGSLVVTADGTDHQIGAGQTIDFRADRPHTYRNDGTAPVSASMVVTMPPGEWDRRRHR
jgi:transcriptional regulator with XRE-family HTH domain